MWLDQYSSGEFDRGRSVWVEMLWIFVQAAFVSSWLPGSRHRVLLLRLFGARLGTGVVLKPHLRVKFPWYLRVGDHTWLGEDVWIDNLAEVYIGSHCCISQGAYLCTGSHDWSVNTFDLIVRPITIRDHVWIAARAVVAPGVEVGEGAVLALGAVAISNLRKGTIYAGNPALSKKLRNAR